MIYAELFWLFFRISLISFGGVFGVLPEMQRAVVSEFQWLTAHQFVQSFVVGQFVPGPNMSLCPLIGYRVAGFWGAVAAGCGIYLGPLSMMATVSTAYYRYREKAWVRRLEVALRPLVLGLIASSSFIFLRQQMGAEWLLGLMIGLPLVYLNWIKKINAMAAVFLAGALWWAIWRVQEFYRIN